MSIVAVALWVTVGQPVSAGAQTTDPDELARSHFEVGASHYESGEYERALDMFQRAYDLSQRPQLLYNLALTYERLGRLPEAVAHLRRYLEEAPDAGDHASYRRRLVRWERRAAAAGGDGETRDRESAAESGAGAAEAAESGGGVPAAALVSFMVGGVGVAVMGVFGGLAVSKRSSVEDTCGRGCSDHQVEPIRTLALVSDVGLAVGVVGAALGVLFLLTGDVGDADDESAPAVHLVPTTDGRATVGAMVQGSF